MAVGIAVLLALAARPSDSAISSAQSYRDGAFSRVASGEAVPLAPRTVGVEPAEMWVESVTVGPTITIDDGYAGPAPLGAPGPEPLDLPFGTEVRVTSDTRAQSHPSVLSVAGGFAIYVAYTNQTSPTNRDVYVALTPDGGANWIHLPIAVSPSYNEFDPKIVLHGSRLVVFFANDDAGNQYGFRRAESMDFGMSWNVVAVNYGGPPPIRAFIRPDASTNGQFLYAVYETECYVPANCANGPSRANLVAMFDASTMLVSSVYFPFTADGINPMPVTEPRIVVNNDQTYWIADADATNLPGGGPGMHDVLWMHTPTGTNSGTSWLEAFITQLYSTDFVRPDASGWQPNLIFLYQLINPSQGLPDHIIVTLYSPDTGASWFLDIVAGQPGVQFKDPAVFARPPLTHATFYMGGNLGYANSTDASVTWSAPFKVNSNTGTVLDAIWSNDLAAEASLGPLIVWQDNRDGNDNIFFSGFQRYTVTIETAPNPNLLVRFGTTEPYSNAPIQRSFPAGSSVTVDALDPQGGPPVQYAFARWDDGTTTSQYTFTVTADVTRTASFTTQYETTIATNPPSRNVLVNMVTRTGPYTFYCDANAVVALDVPSPQNTGPTSRYRYDSWSDGLGQAHSITCTQPQTVTANFVQQFLVTVRTSPVNLDVTVAGTVRMSPWSDWYDQNSALDLLAITPQATGPDEQYRFVNWVGGPSNVAWTVAITGATDYVANYQLQYRVVIDTNPSVVPGLNVTVQGNTVSAPATYYWDAGSLHTVVANSPQTRGLTRYEFSAWDDGDPSATKQVLADAPKTVIAIYTTYYYLETSANMGTVSPASGWQLADELVSLTATPPTGDAENQYVFTPGWTGDLVSTVNPTQILMDGPKSVRAEWTHEFRIEFSSNIPTSVSVQVTVDSVAHPLPWSEWWADGSDHTFSVLPQVVEDAENRWNFEQWIWLPSGGTVSTSPEVSVVSISEPTRYQAVYARQFLITIVTVPTGRAVTVDGVAYTAPVWADEGGMITVAVNTPQAGTAGIRYVFASWEVSGPGASRQYTVTGPATLTATFTTQYQLVIDSDYGDPECLDADDSPCWYNEGSTARARVTTPFIVGGTTWIFSGWSGDATGAGATISVVMNGPKTLTAGWREQSFLEAYGVMLGILIAVIAAILIALLLLMRRRKKQEPEAARSAEDAPSARAPPPPPSAAPAGGTKACAACGMEIPASATTCPVCGSPT